MLYEYYTVTCGVRGGEDFVVVNEYVYVVSMIFL